MKIRIEWEKATQHSQKINAWIGIMLRIIGPFSIESNITSDNYLNLLRNQIIPAIQDIAEEAFQNIWFQQDGAPAHFSLWVWNFFSGIFTDRWIGRRGTIEWLPGLSPLDFF